jgi:hypothetical protein
MLLDSGLADFEPICEYEKIHNSTIFFGCEIKNRYDEERICIKNYNDLKIKRYSYKPNNYYNSTPIFLYGFCFDPKGEDRHLVSHLGKLDKIDLITYSNLLEKYSYKPGENFLKLTQNIYPLDPVHIEKYMTGFDVENAFIFNSDVPVFQQFTSINMYILL